MSRLAFMHVYVTVIVLEKQLISDHQMGSWLCSDDNNNTIQISNVYKDVVVSRPQVVLWVEETQRCRSECFAILSQNNTLDILICYLLLNFDRNNTCSMNTIHGINMICGRWSMFVSPCPSSRNYSIKKKNMFYKDS